MGRPKPAAKKKQAKRGSIDFKKIKKKIGRRLPPPKNATNTEIKSRAIVVPEQSLVSDRTGLAQSNKGLTLKELLQQSSHTNVKSRRGALTGIKELLFKNTSELKLHNLAIIEKLRERISDDDKVVRETFYELLKSVIFPGSKEENSGPFTSLIMAYIFNAMTHLSIDIRLMAFKFFDLVVQHYPSSFLTHAEKVLQNYEDMLRKNHIYLEDKSQLKNGLLGLVHCLSLLPRDKKEVHSSFGKTIDARRALHAFEPDVSKEQTGAPSMVKKLENLMPVLFNCFQELAQSVRLMPQVDAQSLECMSSVLQSIDLAVKFFVYGIDRRQSGFEVLGPCMHKEPDVTVWGETVMPRLLKKLEEVFPIGSVHHHTEKVDDRYNVLNVGIVMIFLHFGEWIYTPTIVMEKFMQFIESMLSGQIFSTKRSSKALCEKHLVSLLPFIPRLLSQAASSWKSGLLQAFTSAFKGCKPESSLTLAFLSAIEEMLLPVVLQLQLRLGQCAPMSTFLVSEYDSTQYSLREFYCTFLDREGGGIRYGPFVKLPKDCQELAASCLYYFSSLESLFLKTLACCCLCEYYSFVVYDTYELVPYDICR
ncbi:hypothetical protein GIB67_014250 [Kingdonia uniflora]|uniref:Pre-rRNA-processing protein Ipi1 N-terminal domain-containing protein n=1 Tax=Kingdonia uniflora TaxID=39325 RepID=A0A7J7M1Y1_9MAGN|nr:hypothetical protein GIB67_014250 [Kingdonia uniflora]